MDTVGRRRWTQSREGKKNNSEWHSGEKERDTIGTKREHRQEKQRHRREKKRHIV